MNDKADDFIQLVERARSGDGQAAGKLLEHISLHLEEGLRRTLAVRKVPGLEAEDIVQETFVKAYERLLDGRLVVEDEEQLRAFLWKVAQNILLDSARAQSRQKRGGGWVHEKRPVSEAASGALLPEWHVDATEQGKRLAELLPEEEQRQIVLWKLEKATDKDIADRLKIDVRSVERKLNRIRSLWKEHLAQAGFGAENTQRPEIAILGQALLTRLSDISEENKKGTR